MEIYPIFKLHYTYETRLKHNGMNVEIEYRVLSKKEMLNLYSKYYKDNSPNNYYKVNIVKTSLINPTNIIDMLSDDDIEYLYTDIVKKSTINQDLLDELKESVSILNSDKMKSDTWDCEECKESGFLQQQRNCAFLENCEDCNKDFMMAIDGKLYRQCPKSLLNQQLVKAGYDCFFMYNKGILPESGGMLDQTEFFNEVAISMYNWTKQAQNDALEEQTEY